MFNNVLTFFIACYAALSLALKIRTMSVIGQNIVHDLRADLFKHLQKLPYSFYDNHETGRIMTRLTSDLFEICELVGIKSEYLEKSPFDLSGGEKRRVAVAGVISMEPEILILDEPTNHLDIASREILEDALSGYDGTIFCVSHDRFLVNKLATRILVFDDGDIRSFEGTYEDYANALDSQKQNTEKPQKKVNEYQLRKEQESLERKRKTRIRKLEEEIEQIENEKNEVQSILDLPETAADYEKLIELTEKLNALNERQETLYEEWMEINL